MGTGDSEEISYDSMQSQHKPWGGGEQMAGGQWMEPGGFGTMARWMAFLHGRHGFNSWVGKIPWKRERLPTPVFWLGEFHRLYSPWDHKELDMTERLSLYI